MEDSGPYGFGVVHHAARMCSGRSGVVPLHKVRLLIARVRWLLARQPDVLGLVKQQAEVMNQGVAAFARWSVDGSPDHAQAVRDAEHQADEIRHALLQVLTSAMTASIEQEDAYALSERIDEVVDRAKDTVRLASALEWTPDKHAAEMGSCVKEAAAHIYVAIDCLGHRSRDPGHHADLAIKEARRVQHFLLAGVAALPRDGDAFARTATLELYRSYAEVGQALLRVADRTWYAVLKIL